MGSWLGLAQAQQIVEEAIRQADGMGLRISVAVADEAGGLPDAQAIEALAAADIDTDVAARLLRERPLPERLIDDLRSLALTALLEGHREQAP